MNVDESQPQPETPAEFTVDASLRRRKLAFQFFRVAFMIIAMMVLGRLGTGRPLFAFPAWFYAIAFGFPALQFLVLSAWGTGIRFEPGGITILKWGQIQTEIPRGAIQSIRLQPAMLLIHYKVDQRVQMRPFGRNGFTDERWKELEACCTSYFPQTTRAR